MSSRAPAAPGAPPGLPPATPLSGAFRAVWRWHFYAGLLVLPFLMLMALTGALYLFTDEIDAAVYGDLSRVEPRAGSAAPDLWVAAAETGLGGKVANVLVRPAGTRPSA